MSTPVEMDRACPKTLLQPLRSRWYRFPSQSYNYFRYPSAILEFLGEGSIGRGGHVHHWKTCFPKHRYSHWDCVDICFRCWVISTSGLGLCFYFRFVPDAVLRSRTTSLSVEVMPENCVVAAYIAFISLVFSSRHQLITTSGLRPPYWTYKCMKCTTWPMWVRLKKLRTKITGISSPAATESDILLGGNLSPPLLATYVIKTH